MSLERKFRVAEIFGPTIQGEGRQAGLSTYFIRFGGCDLRCTWCDTPHAVLPDLVAQLPRMDVDEICDSLDILEMGPDWVVITGGNPATLRLDGVVEELHARDYKVMVETQGTVFNSWLRDADELCISPKPPSSGNIVTPRQLEEFIQNIPHGTRDKIYLKVVVFNDEDYLYAQLIHKEWPELDFYISVGNNDPELPTVGCPDPDVEGHGGPSRGESRDRLGHNYREMCERVARDDHMQDVKVLPQLHVLAWGNERGR